MSPPAPGKIICVGRNYAAHARELGNAVPERPLLFFKPTSAVIGDGEPIRLPAASERVEYEGEIGVVLGRRLRRATADACAEAIAGIVAANDVTARDLQKVDGQWARAKGFDSFCPLGTVATDGWQLDDLSVITRVNGEERQRGHVRDMIFPIVDLLAYVSAIMTLEPGDLLLTGTPEGVGPLVAGDMVEIEVPGVGLVRNPVTLDDR
jgi:2-keto-4-pentenoate hydratase/2-oxohepta-3-ene-1,7-dioic acid hydratase in catechol pathway